MYIWVLQIWSHSNRMTTWMINTVVYPRTCRDLTRRALRLPLLVRLRLRLRRRRGSRGGGAGLALHRGEQRFLGAGNNARRALITAKIIPYDYITRIMFTIW